MRFHLLLTFILAATPVSAQSFECREVLAPMRDGVRLATDVYVPKGQGAGPFPVVLERTPYDKGDCENAHAQYFASRGYVAMIRSSGPRRSPTRTGKWERWACRSPARTSF
jgi:predicted acyl esterase